MLTKNIVRHCPLGLALNLQIPIVSTSDTEDRIVRILQWGIRTAIKIWPTDALQNYFIQNEYGIQVAKNLLLLLNLENDSNQSWQIAFLHLLIDMGTECYLIRDDKSALTRFGGKFQEMIELLEIFSKENLPSSSVLFDAKKQN